MEAPDDRIRRQSLVVAVVLSILVLAFGCLFLAYRLLVFIGRSSTPAGCIPPDEFSESKLVGEWWAEFVLEPQVSDTLIIREDGLYKQIIHMESPETYIETDWEPWRLEYDRGGLPYLHLQGMRLCAANQSMDCNQRGGGERDWNAYNENFYWDFCRNESTLMVDEGILIVRAVPAQWRQPPRGIELALLVNCTDCGPWVYELREP